MAVKTTSKGWTFFKGHGHDLATAEVISGRIDWLRENGWKCRPNWDRNAPLGVHKIEGTNSYYIGVGNLIDHPYRLVTPENEIIYVSEPYYIHDFKTLNMLRREWHIEVNAGHALWYPGRTVAISFRKKDARFIK